MRVCWSQHKRRWWLQIKSLLKRTGAKRSLSHKLSLLKMAFVREKLETGGVLNIIKKNLLLRYSFKGLSNISIRNLHFIWKQVLLRTMQLILHPNLDKNPQRQIYSRHFNFRPLQVLLVLHALRLRKSNRQVALRRKGERK